MSKGGDKDMYTEDFRENFLNKCSFTPARREIKIACMEQRESLVRVGQ